eukprot:jgi/Chlat1/5950/Chrsp4S06270
MAFFWKPGRERPDQPAAALSSSAAIDRDASGPQFTYVHNKYSTLGIDDQRTRLPVYKHRTQILYLVETHATTIIVGQTGSGKTTQVPQYLLEGGWAAGGRMIACTQPRRVAAQGAAARVAEERGVQLGGEVGYSVRFDDVSTAGVTRIRYVTDGVLIQEMMSDPLLTRYSVIMVDEAHERGLQTDLLLGLLKKVQRRRPELRLIISSATLNAREFAAFFDASTKKRKFDDKPSAVQINLKPAILSVQGRMHPVQTFFLSQPAPDYVQASVAAAVAIHRTQPPGDVLIFLTGQEEVDTAVEMINEQSREIRGPAGQSLLVIPLYAGLPADHQARMTYPGAYAFQPPPRGKRKVIVSTNIAETSLTIEGIVYVVDCGFSKQRFYNPVLDAETLVVAPISRASAKQRTGRAGRVRPGKCYRMYTEDYYKTEMEVNGVPEMQRSSLASTILQLKALGIDNIMNFDWPSPPPPEHAMKALELLYALGAIGDDSKLKSPDGLKMAELPVEPGLARALLAAGEMGCGVEMVTIAATLCVQSIWIGSRGRQREQDEKKEAFAVAEGDHITYLNVWTAFIRTDSRKQGKWCHAHGVNYRAMLRVAEIRAQIGRTLRRLGVALESCGSDTKPVRRALTAGFFSNAARLQPHGDGSTYVAVRSGQLLRIHPSSVLFRATPAWVVFNGAELAEQDYMKEVAAIEMEWLTELAPHFYSQRK